MVTMRRTPGAWPLNLAQGIADVPHDCASCRSTFIATAPVVTHWLDHKGALAQDAVSRGVDCPACGAAVPFAAPLIQMRQGDVADLLIAVPADSDSALDAEWISAARSAVPELRMADAIVPVRADWWQAISSAPLGPILVGIVDPPFPAPSEEIAAWRASVRELLPVPPVVRAVHQLALTDTFVEAQKLVREHPELLHARWRTTVRAVVAALMDAQVDADVRRVVEQRTLRRLRTLVLFRGGAPAEFPDTVRSLIDSAVAHAPSDDARLGAVMAATAALEEAFGETMEVAAGLTSLARALYDNPDRRRADIGEAVKIATRAAMIAERVFDADHELVLMNKLNAFVMSADLLGSDAAEVVPAMEELRTFALLPGVLTSPHLPDALTNLASLVHRRTDLPRGARMELQLDILAQAERAAALVDPDNDHLQFVIATNIATTYGARIVGTRNTATAAAALRSTEAAGPHLTSVEQLMRMTTEVSIQFEEAIATGLPDDFVEVIRRCTELRDAALALGPDNEAAITALTNSAAITSDLVRRLGDSDGPAAEWLAGALQTARAAVERAKAHLGRTSNAHLTALIGLGNLESQVQVGGASPAHSDAAETYLRTIELAEGVSDVHVAVAWRNLGTLYFEAGKWTEAATALRHAADARRRLVGTAEEEQIILGEVADSEDLAGREAIAWVIAGQPLAAVAAVESGRAHLLRRRLGIVAGVSEPLARPGATTIHLSGSNIGTSLVIRGADGLRIAEVYAIGAEVGDLAVALLRARSRASRSAVLQRLGELVHPVVSAVVAATQDDVDVSVIASGGWAGVPLHLLLRTAGGPHWGPIVRYLPSEGIASVLRARTSSNAGDAVAFIDPDGDLSLAESEGTAFTRAHYGARILRGAITRAAALAAITDADTVHLAGHARFDADDPTRSYLSLGGGQRLTFSDLIAAADARRLRLVVASACQAGASGTWNPDEMTAVAHGFLHVGARAVVTALWDVNDLPAALLMCALYNSPAIHTDPAAALAEAQEWLRTLTPSTLGCRAHWLPAELAERLRQYLDRLEADEAPFAEGIDWGAFAYVGP